MKKFNVFFVVLTLILGLAACGSNAGAWQEHYDLGTKYLNEGKYEEAVLEFTKAIDIDPKSAPAYVGRGDAYVGLAENASDGAKAGEYYSKALTDYEKASELGDKSAQSKADSIQGIIGKNSAELKELYDCMASGNTDGAVELMRGEKYINLSSSIADGYLMYRGSSGKTLAAYPDNYYYYGDFSGGVRSGNGIWICAVYGEDSRFDRRIYDGQWANDLPDGKGHITTICDESKIQLEAGQTTSVRTEIDGSFKNGLYHGDINEVWYMNDGDVHTWDTIKAVDGVYQPIPVPEDMASDDYVQENYANGEYLVSFANETTDLWDSGDVRYVFGFSKK